ncbi:helix-turn-helix domain-containing protein [Rhodococcus hoagii]|nr:helix-turn-helix domain-containing protein [Prescottella equi]
MATRRVEIGPTGETVRTNIAKARKDQHLTLRDLAERLAANGRPLAHNTLSEIERGARRVDVDDLFAIAVALDVSPSVLLVPASDDGDELVAATGVTEPLPARDVRNFVDGLYPLGPARQSRIDALQFALRALPRYTHQHWRTFTSDADLPTIETRTTIEGAKVTRLVMVIPNTGASKDQGD